MQKINCHRCGEQTEKGKHRGRYCKTCYNVRQKMFYNNSTSDYVFLNEGETITPSQLARMSWRKQCTKK